MSQITVRLASLALIALISALPGKAAHALTLGQAAQLAKAATPAAFNAVEFNAPREAESRVDQWNRARVALGNDTRQMQDCLSDASRCESQAMRSWRQMVVSVRGQDEMTMLNTVNTFFNRWTYISDIENYRVSEYWASPLEFMAKGGDCEDFAIAKYVTLKLMGYQDRSLRIMAVMDNARGGMGHAVLSVAVRGSIMVLDNRSTVVYDNTAQTDYVPRFAVNESGIYTYAVQPRVVMASNTF